MVIRVAIIQDDPALSARFADAISAAMDMIVAKTANSVISSSGLTDAGVYDVLLCAAERPEKAGPCRPSQTKRDAPGTAWGRQR